MQQTSLNPPSPPPPAVSSKLKQACDLIGSIISSNSNGMLAAILSLILAVLFVLMLHAYAKWFLAQARRRSQRDGSSVSLPHALGSHFHHLHTFPVETRSDLPSSPTTTRTMNKGLESSAIASIPLFVYKGKEHKQGLECVICLNVFEEEEVGRKLPRCLHAFHVECIDMWLHSHVSCPICRVPVIIDDVNDKIIVDDHYPMSSTTPPPHSVVIGNVDSVEEPSTTTTVIEIVIEVTSSENSSISAANTPASGASSLGLWLV